MRRVVEEILIFFLKPNVVNRDALIEFLEIFIEFSKDDASLLLLER